MSLRAPYGTVPRGDLDPVEAALRPLSARVIAEMYQDDPFWETRFGTNGRRHAHNDGDFHASYLAQALHQASPAVMTRYARWLRDLLVARGMCSWHLEENFARLRVVVLGTDLPFASATAALLETSMTSLHHTTAPAADVERLIPSLEQAIRARALVSYLADALAIRDAKHFVAHVMWRRSLSEESSVRSARMQGDVDASLHAMSRVLEAHLERSAWVAAREVLEKARPSA